MPKKKGIRTTKLDNESRDSQVLDHDNESRGSQVLVHPRHDDALVNSFGFLDHLKLSTIIASPEVHRATISPNRSQTAKTLPSPTKKGHIFEQQNTLVDNQHKDSSHRNTNPGDSPCPKK